jgi:hypothetical protein
LNRTPVQEETLKTAAILAAVMIAMHTSAALAQKPRTPDGRPAGQLLAGPAQRFAARSAGRPTGRPLKLPQSQLAPLATPTRILLPKPPPGTYLALGGYNGSLRKNLKFGPKNEANDGRRIQKGFGRRPQANVSGASEESTKGRQ